MSSLATSGFLRRLKALYPTAARANPWAMVASVAFSASNQPEAVPCVFKHALKGLESGHGVLEGANSPQKPLQDQRIDLARSTRDALFKSGLLSGYPKAINSLVELHKVMPVDLRETRTLRNVNTSLEEYEQAGHKMFDSVYGETSSNVKALLHEVYPDMGWFSVAIGYGITYGFTDSLSALDTSYMMIAALIASDQPLQITWHLEGAKRGGATVEEVRAVRAISIEVARQSGVEWKDRVPDVVES